MELKITANTLKKLELLFDEARYLLRFEKGNFNSGYCILEDKKVIVINKFLNLESRINTLADILPNIQVIENELSSESLKFYKQLMGQKKSNNTQLELDLNIEE